jgi:hypothetical protein
MKPEKNWIFFMDRTGRNRFIALFLIILLFPLPLIGEEKTKSIEIEKTPDVDVHYRMLERLKLDDKTHEYHESFFRRGEVVFFVSFGYIWMYQFLLYDQVLKGSYGEGGIEGELVDRNLFFGVITSMILAFFVSRNDLQHYHRAQKGAYYRYSGLKDPSFDRDKKGYNWYFNFFSWEF